MTLPAPPGRPGLVALVLLVGAAGLGATAGAAPSGERGVRLAGTLLDDRSDLRRALGLDRLPGGKLEGAARKRVLDYLEALDYRVKEERRGDQTVLRLTPYTVVRRIYIKGNWPIFEDEILRRVRFRPGQRLPRGDAFKVAVQRQERRINQFLSREGYFDGSLRIEVEPAGVPHRVNLVLRLLKGKRYKVGEVKVEPMVRRRDRSRAGDGRGGGRGEGGGEGGEAQNKSRKRLKSKKKHDLAVSEDRIGKMFQQKLLFYQRAFSTERFKEDVKELTELFHKRRYPGVRVRESFEVDRKRPADEAVRITLRIQQRKQIRVRYLGNDHADEDELDDQLTLYEEGTYDDYELAQSSRKIRRFYQGKGFLLARVHFSRKVGARRDVVTFHIKEGPRFRVKEVTFSGNKSMDSERLRQVVRTRPFPLLGWLGLAEGGYVSDLQLRQDIGRIREAYEAEGFAAAQVTAALAPTPRLLGHPAALAATLGYDRVETGDLYVHFTVDEGSRRTVEQVVVHDNEAISDAQLKERLALKVGGPFAAKMVDLDRARIVRIYSERGRPYAAVRSLEEVSADESRVTVHFTVRESRAVRFGPVFIRGNFRTRRRVVMNHVDIEAGAPFDIRKIERAERELRRRELFNSVRVRPLGLSEQPDEVPVIVTVEERYDDWGSLELAVGGSTDNKLFGAVAYRNHNVLGFGTELSLRAEYGWEIWSGSVHYRDPRLLGSAFVLDVKGFARNQDTERLGELLTFGGTLSLSREIAEGLTGIVRYEIRRSTHREDLFRPSGVDESGRVEVATRVGGLGLTVVYDQRDHPVNPTRGFRAATSLFGASRYLGGTDHFFKLNVNGQAFIPLPLSMTIALNVRYDHGFPLGGRVVLPKVERFYAGGDTTIRGLEEDLAFVERVTMAAAPLAGVRIERLRPQGGSIRLITNAEFQFPIWKESILFGFPIMGALFSDNGVVTNSWQGFEARQFRHGVGAALRVVTPVGFTSIAYAFALDPEPGDPEWGRLHFNFGYIF